MRDHSYIRYGTGLVGIIYTALGALGFLPVNAINPLHLEGIGARYLFNLVAINAAHNLIHLAIGVTGIWAMSRIDRARLWGMIVGITLLAVFAAGMVQAAIEGFPFDQSLCGVVPLNSPGHTLHLATATVALYLGLADRGDQRGAGGDSRIA